MDAPPDELGAETEPALPPEDALPREKPPELDTPMDRPLSKPPRPMDEAPRLKSPNPSELAPNPPRLLAAFVEPPRRPPDAEAMPYA